MAPPPAMQTVARTLSCPADHSEAVVWHVHEDLRGFMDARKVELGDVLGIPAERRALDDGELLELLCDDVGRLLRDGVVHRVHVLMHEPELDAATGAHLVVRRSTYEIGTRPAAGGDGPRRRGGLLLPSELMDGWLAILLEPRPASPSGPSGRLSPPRYHLTWGDAGQLREGMALLRWADGCLAADEAAIVRPGETWPHGVARYLDAS